MATYVGRRPGAPVLVTVVASVLVSVLWIATGRRGARRIVPRGENLDGSGRFAQSLPDATSALG